MKGHITPERKAEALNICREKNLTDEIFVKSRKSEYVYKRYLAIEYLTVAGFKGIEIAGFLDLDHASVWYLKENYVLGSSNKIFRTIANRRKTEIVQKKDTMDENMRNNFLRALRIY